MTEENLKEPDDIKSAREEFESLANFAPVTADSGAAAICGQLYAIGVMLARLTDSVERMEG